MISTGTALFDNPYPYPSKRAINIRVRMAQFSVQPEVIMAILFGPLYSIAGSDNGQIKNTQVYGPVLGTTGSVMTIPLQNLAHKI